jgi:site-specific DNA-adenine methylase|tara:strand:- start:349 stop:534 length:186 start_codon:yes stop_codon:yes gene_type:complete
MNKKIISIRDDLYQVYRVLKDNPKWEVDILKKLWNCTHTFKHQEKLYVCRIIEEVKYEKVS